MGKQIIIEATEPIKVADGQFEIVEKKTIIEEKTKIYTIADLEKRKGTLIKAVASTEKQKIADAAKHDSTIVMLGDQIAVIDEKIVQANVLLTAEPIE